MRIHRIIGTALLGSWLVATPAFAVFGVGDTAIVSDPIVEIQTASTVERLWDTIKQQADMIENQVKSIEQGAQNLLKTPMDIASQITGAMNQYNSTMATVNGIGYTVEGTKQQWHALYGGVTSGGSIVQQAQAIMQAVQQASLTAAQTQAIYTRLCNQAAQVQALLGASRAAPGSLAAQQAQAQLTAIGLDQQAMLAQIQAATGRVQIMQAAEDARTTLASQENARQAMEGFLDIKPTPFGQGQGPALPQ